MFLLPKSGGGKETCPCQIQDAGYQLILLFTVHTAKQLFVFGSKLEFICSVAGQCCLLVFIRSFLLLFNCNAQLLSAVLLSTWMFQDPLKREGIIARTLKKET